MIYYVYKILAGHLLLYDGKKCLNPIKFRQILKNANVGPNVDISVTEDRRPHAGQSQQGNFNIHVR